MVGSRVHAVEPRLRIPKILATENQLARRSLIWLVVGNMFYFSIYWESSSQLTFIFFRGVETTNQMESSWELLESTGN